MSKKDRQHQHIQPIKHEQTTIAGMKVVPDTSLPPGTIELRGAEGTGVRVEGLKIDIHDTEKTPCTSGDPSRMGSEARIQHLEAELAKERARADEYRRAEEALLVHLRPFIVDGKTPEETLAFRLELLKDTDAKWTRAVEDRDRLANELQAAEAQRKALHSDLMVLEQTAAGHAPDIALQTDLGKSAAHALSEVLTMLDKMNKAHLEGDALPANGWSSDTARQLVAAIEPRPGLRASDVRCLLLGDLLAQLLPHTGEQGQNETASDVLKRIVAQVDSISAELLEAGQTIERYEQERRATSLNVLKVQSAMVARRAPDAEAGMLLSDMTRVLGPVCDAMGHDRKHVQAFGLPILHALVKEWQGLRSFLSEAPLTAVAIRDDGTKEVRERYSLLVLTWDGKAVQTRVVEISRPWGDIAPYLQQTVVSNLVPGAYR